MARSLNPPKIRAPFGRYSHGVEVPPGSRLVFCSGQLGADEFDEVPESVEEQAEHCFRNIGAILTEASLTFRDIIRINAYVTARAHMPGYMAVRDRFVGNPPPASTLMIVAGFTRPEFLVEVEAVAAGPAY